jgi:PKD repeat protein
VGLVITNQSPVAALSVTPISGTTPVTVTASTAGSSDPDGTIASTTINFGDGSASVNAATATHIYNTAGTYTVTATVTDNLGASTSKTATVTVAANQPPVAVLSVTPSSGIAPVTVAASTGGSSDPDGTIASTIIDFGDGSASVNAASATHVYNIAGTYTVTTTVTDNLGASTSQTATVVVAANKSPIALLSLSSTNGYGPLTITASTAGSSDPDGTIASSTVNFGDGAIVNGASATHTYSTPGTYTVTATVTDNLGASSSTTASVTVKAPEVIVSGPTNGTTSSSPAHIVASGFSGYTVTAMQIYLDYSLAYTANAASLDTNLKMGTGTHNLIIKGWDSSGRNFSKSLSITVTNQPPVATVSTSANSVLVGGSVTASSSGSYDPDGIIAGTVINFGDGSASVSATSASHQYKVAGTYTVKVTVTDNMGATSTASTSVQVQPQYVNMTSPTSGTTSTSSVQVTGSGFSGYVVTAMQVYLDGVLKYQTSASSVNTTLSISTGSHSVVLQGWDASGATFKAQTTVMR